METVQVGDFEKKERAGEERGEVRRDGGAMVTEVGKDWWATWPVTLVAGPY